MGVGTLPFDPDIEDGEQDGEFTYAVVTEVSDYEVSGSFNS